MNFKLILLVIFIFLGCQGTEQSKEGGNTTSSQKTTLNIDIISKNDSSKSISLSELEVYIYKQDDWEKVDYRSSKFNQGDRVKISLENVMVVDFIHNIPISNIIENTISTNVKDRLKPMNITFYIDENIDMKLSIAERIDEKLKLLCSEGELDDIKIFGLNSNLEKENIYENQYEYSAIFGGAQYGTYFDIDDIKEEYLLAECYEHAEVTYRAILHIDEWYDYWFAYYTPVYYHVASGIYPIPDYRISLLTDLYYRGYKSFMDKGFSIQVSKQKSHEIIKKIFNDYPTEEIGFYSANIDDDTRKKDKQKVEDYLTYIDEKITLMEIHNQITLSTVLGDLEKYLFDEDIDINNDVKANFLLELLSLVSNNNDFTSLDYWEQTKSIDSSESSGNIALLNNSYDGNDYTVKLELLSNREQNEEQSVVALTQKVNISSFDYENLYFKIDLNQIEGKREKDAAFGLYNCTGMAGIALEYIDENDLVKGSTILVSMTDAWASGLTGSIRLPIWLGGGYSEPLVINNSQTLESTSKRRVIKLDKTSYKDLTISISDEMKKITNITNIYDIKKVNLVLFVADAFTENSASCGNAESILEVSKAGLYSVQD